MIGCVVEVLASLMIFRYMFNPFVRLGQAADCDLDFGAIFMHCLLVFLGKPMYVFYQWQTNILVKLLYPER